MGETEGDFSTAMTVPEVSAYLKMAESTVYRLARERKLPGRKVGGAWRFSRKELEKWLTRRSAEKDLQQKEYQKSERRQEIRNADDWLKVQALALQEILLGYVDTEAAGDMYREKTTEAKRLQLADFYKQGERALQDKNWESAVIIFEQVVHGDPTYHEVSEMLAQITAELRRAKLYDKALMQGAAGEQIQASRSWLALLTEQWDYRQGEAVQQFMGVVEELLDQIDQEDRSQQGEIFEPERTSSELPESSPEQLPNEPTRTNELVDELSKQKTERLEGLLRWESEMLDQSPDDLAQIAADNWLGELATNRTERLEELPGQEPSTSQKASENQVQADNWMDEQVTKRTERFEEVPVRNIDKTTEAPENWARSGDWFDLQTTNKTERLDDHSVAASARREQSLNNGKMSRGQDGKEMLRIPAGDFLYGIKKKLIQLDEFWIDKAPVTNAEYKRFLEARPAHPVPYSDLNEDKLYNWDKKTRTFPRGMASRPVVLVTLEDVRTYAKWAGKRLPTEQEWEKAARGVDGRTYPWGKIWQVSACNSKESGIGGTTPVGMFSPAGDSPYGCVDMSGNVWEWTTSEFSETSVVVRGGSWRNSPLDAWCMTRAGNLPSIVKNSIGFRLVSK